MIVTFIENTGIGKYEMTLIRFNLTTGEPEYISAAFDRNVLSVPYAFNISTVKFLWAGIRNAPEDVQQYPFCGMDLTGAGAIYEKVNDMYPAFELSVYSDNEALRASDYENHFTSLLRYSIDHTGFLNAIKADAGQKAYYQYVLNYVTENGLKTYGVLVKGSAADILAQKDSGVVSQLTPLDADVVF